MKSRTVRVLSAVVALMIAAAAAPAQERPVLESYTLDSLNDPRGVYYRIYDRSFGGGSADMSLRLLREDATSTLVMRITRKIPEGGIAFALLVDRIHVQAFSGDQQVYERDRVDFLPGGIMFGDSKSGKYQERFEGIPPEASRVVVTIYGNYE